MSKTPGESGIDELRKLVNLANNTAESAFDGLSAEECVRLLQACRALDLETSPDQLSGRERAYASRTGKIHHGTLHRLYNLEGGPKTGPDWEGR